MITITYDVVVISDVAERFRVVADGGRAGQRMVMHGVLLVS